MSGTALTFPFVDLQQRLRQDRLNRLAHTGHRTQQAPARTATIKEVTGWLFRAQDALIGQSMAGSYHLQTGWSSMSLEATAAAIPTLLRLAERFPEQQAHERAVLLGLTLSERIFTDGNHPPVDEPGGDASLAARAVPAWLELYRDTRDDRFKAAARRAGETLTLPRPNRQTIAEPPLGQAAPKALALAHLACKWRNARYRQAALIHGTAVISSISPDGYPIENNHYHRADPALAQITEVIHAVLETGILTGNQLWIDIAERGAQRIYDLYRANGTLAGRYGPGWRADYSFHCMTGCARTALIWLRLYQQGYRHDYFEAAARVNDFVASTVDTSHPDPGITGGIRAAYPLWVDYYPMAYRTLAAKFALDAWLLEDALTVPRKPKRKLHLKRRTSGENA